MCALYFMSNIPEPILNVIILFNQMSNESEYVDLMVVSISRLW